MSPSTAVLVIDPYNDFTSPLGKGWPLIRAVAKEVRLIANLKRVLAEARRRGIPVVYAPHSRYRRGKGRDVKWPNPSQFLVRLSKFFTDGRYGGRFRTDLAPAPGEFVASEHAISSGFGGTDLDQHLRSIGAEHLVVCGLLTNTCVESTVRHAVDLGYMVTVLNDGVAAWSHEDHAAALDGSLRKIAHSVDKTEAWIGSLR
jgi:nicotinamidase-related amidase